MSGRGVGGDFIMAIQAIEESKQLRKFGDLVGREGISKRAIEICQEVAANPNNYFKAVEAIGRMKALFIACKFDLYWDEKSFLGYRDELWKAEKALEVVK
jgi:hypothetical protein